MNELALFAGAGGGILAGQLLGHNIVCAVERDAYAAQLLAQRQNDGTLKTFPIWSDIKTFDGRPWRGIVELVSGGFPCQDISPANANSKGLRGEKSSLWFEMLRIIHQVKPKWVLVENSAHLRTKGLGIILKGFSEAGYSAAWCVLSAKDLGANHERKRMWIVARHNNSATFLTQKVELATNPNSTQCQRRRISSRGKKEHPHFRLGSWWKDTPSLNRMDDEVAHRVERLKAIGNGQVPLVAAIAFLKLSRLLNGEVLIGENNNGYV